MPRVKSQKTTENATATANSKTKKDTEPKVKRTPTAYNIFVSEQLKLWKVAYPNAKQSEGMTYVAALWKNSDKNPNKGKEPKPKKPKASKAPEVDKENDIKPSKDAKKVKVFEETEVGEATEEGE